MKNFAILLDKAPAAFLLCVFLIFSTVNCQCPAVEDQRTSDCRATYISLNDGNLTRALDIFAGKIKPAFCIAHCGCLSKAYAGLDINGHCFCGDSQGSICSGQSECLRVYSTAGIPASPSASFAQKLELFSTGSTTVNGLSNAIQFAVAVDGKLSYFTPSSGSVAFAAPGERKVSVEIEGYWSCRTPDYTVNVYSKVILTLVCPAAVRVNQEFYCYATFTEGSGISELKWTLDNSPHGSTVTSVAAPLVLATGGNMTVDRFDSFNSTCDFSTGDRTTFINPNYEFTAKGRVKAFEAHITRKGYIVFQIFRPMCDQVQTEKTYCHSQRKCVSSGCGTPSTARGKMQFYPPASKPVFCPDVERFKVDDNSTCPSPEDFSTIPADYQLLYQFATNVNQMGNTVIKVPDDKVFVAYPGDVLGWTTGCNASSADIGYYQYRSAYEPMYPEYRYKETFEILINAVFSRKLPTASVFKYYHLLRAHTVNPTNYLKHLKLDSLDQYYTIGVSATAAESSASKSTRVYVQEDITTFVLSASVTDSLINTDITFSTSSANTDVGVSYSYHFGETEFNGTFDQTTSTTSIKKQYAVPGIYTVICRAANKLSYVDRNITVNVFAAITSLEFTKDVDPKATGQISVSTFVASGWGNATATYDLGDNTTLRVLNLTLAKFVYVEVNYEYKSEGDYLIDVEVKHPVGSKRIKQYASVEDTVGDVVIIPPGVVATNISNNYGLTVRIGTNLTHVWSWADGTPNDTSVVNFRNMTHNYTTYGNRTISVYSYNKISNMTCTRFVEVQDLILGLNFTQPANSSYTILPANHSKETETWFTIEQGTGVDIYVDWDSNNPNTRLSPKAYDRDKNNDGGLFMGRAVHKYSTIGTYNVTVYARNEVSEMSVMTTAISEQPISGVRLTVDQLDLTTTYIEVNETVCFTLARSGTNILLRCDFDDKYAQPIITPNITVCKSWTHWHLPFNVTFTLYNNVSTNVTNVPVFVQMPVHNFSNLVIFGGPENTTEAMRLNLQDPTGDFFNCSWTIFDAKGEVAKNLLYTDFLKEGVIGDMYIEHQFKTPGVYDVTVTCINRLYSASAKTNVSSYKPASDFKVTVEYGAACGTKKEEGSKGDGPDSDMYAYGCLLRFLISEQTGSNITYSIDFGDESPKQETTASTVTHTFAQTTENSKKLVVVASNPTSTVKKEYTLKFLPRITGLKIGNDGPVKVGKILNYNVTVEQKGLGSCFLVDCESGKDPETKEIQHLIFWMGEHECSTKTKYKPYVQKPDLNPTRAVWSYTFTSTGKFRCTVTGENSVSLETAFTDVTVLDKPCNKPKLEWNGITDNLKDPTNTTRGKTTTVQVKVTKDCEKTDEVEYHWNITRIKSDDSIEVIKSIEHKITDSALKIPARSLVYGTYGIELKLYMKGVDPPVFSSITGYIKVNPSQIVAKFVGGSGRAGGKDRMLAIDASSSHDPDESPEWDDNIKICWFCKRRSESFPDNLLEAEDVSYPAEGPAPEAMNYTLNVTSSFRGCFGNGVGRLREFDNQNKLQINSSFMPLKQYFTIRIHLSKPSSSIPRENITTDYSLFIVPGDPPEIKISCRVNCGAKKNPDRPFKLVALCTKHCGSKINYEWSIQWKTEMAPDSNLETVNDFGIWLDTGLTQKNLAMKENKMEVKKEYKVRLTGKLDGFEETYGFSLYDIMVNIPPTAPDSSRCRVVPEIGKPLAKAFKVLFTGFVDMDLPLKYFADYRVTGSNLESDWVNFFESFSQISDLMMFPAGQFEGKVEIRFYCEDAFRARSLFVFKSIVVKNDETEKVDLIAVLASNKGSTDPQASSQVANAVLASASKDGGGDVVGEVVGMMLKVEVNSPQGALALSKTMGTCMSSGSVSAEKQAQAMKAMAKCAEQMGPDVPQDIVLGVADAAFAVLLLGSEGGSGDAQESDGVMMKLGATVAFNMVAGEKAFVKKTGKSLVQCLGLDVGGEGAVALDSGGGFDMDSSELGENGAPLQAVGGSGPDKYSNKTSKKKDVTSDVVSLDMSSDGKEMKVHNLSKPISVSIPQPVSPYGPARLIAFTHILLSVSVIDVQNDNESSIFSEIKNETEMYESCFFVIIKKGVKPKLYDNDWNFTLPHVVNRSNPDGTNKTDKELETEQKNRFRVFLHGKRDLNSTAIGTYYLAVMVSPCNSTNVSLSIGNFGNFTMPPVNYTFFSYTGTCKFFNKTSKKWSNEGLDILPETSANFTSCSTTHLSSFAGGGIVAKPNTIDFAKAFAGFSNIGENPTVFATTLSIIGVYFLLLAYCRYKDKKDLEKIEVFPLEDNHPSDTYLYEIGVQTGFVRGAGTTADVFIILNGTLGETSPRKLKNPNRKCFNKSETDSFLLSTPFSLGVIKDIEIWHNNDGNSPGWYCMQVQIRDTRTDKRFIFVCNRWLAVEEDDGKIKRKIEVATKDDLVQFDFLFAQTARKNLYDGHIWFSVFTRPPRSHFTRCQRLGCCLTLLLTSMLANAMFYRDPAPATTTADGSTSSTTSQASDSLHLGPITISIEQIRIGFTSSLVVIPVNLIIATLFQKAKPKEDKKKKEGEKYQTEDEEDEEAAIGSSRNDVSASKIELYEGEKQANIDMEMNDQGPMEPDTEELEREKSKKRANFIRMLCMPGNDDEEDEGATPKKGKKKQKPKAFLPHWVIYIAYILIFVTSGTAAFFVILYGFQFGKEKSDNWMKSMMLSFWQSVLLIQPVKVLALSVLVAMIIKDPKAASEEEGGSKAGGKGDKSRTKKRKKKIGEDGEELDEYESEEEEEEEQDLTKAALFKLPDEKKLEESRQLRLKEKKMKAIIREIVIHLLFVMLCLFIGYSNMNPFAVGFGTSVRSFTGGELQKVTRVEEYWTWIDKTFIPYLYPNKWYNDISPYKAQFVADTEPSKVIAMARMRQLRVKKNTCTKHPVFENIVSECNGPYSWGNEDTEQYSAGWKPPLNASETRKLRHRKRKALWLGLENAWQHQSVLKLKNFPFLGKFGTYSGSSYAVSIGPDERISRLILKYWNGIFVKRKKAEVNSENGRKKLSSVLKNNKHLKLQILKLEPPDLLKISDMKDNFWVDRYTRAIFHEINIYNANTNLMMIFTMVSEILNTGGWNYFDNVQALRLYRWQGGIGGLVAVADIIFMIVTFVGLYKLIKACRKEGVKNYLKSAWNFLHAFVTIFSICTFSCVFARVGAVMWAMKQYKNDPEVFVSFAYLGQLDYFVQAFIGFVVMATNLEFLRLLRFNKKIGLLTATIRESLKPLASFGLIFFVIFLSYVSLAFLLFNSQLEDYSNYGTSVVSLTRMFLGQFDVPAYKSVAPVLGPMLFFTYMVAIQMVLINMFIGIICETFEEVRMDIEKQSNDHEIVSFMTNRFKKIAGAAVGPSVAPIYREWKSEWEMTMDSIEEKSDSIVYLMRNIEAEEVRQNIWFEPANANEKKKNVLAMLVGSDEFTYENELLDTLQLLDKKMKKMTVTNSQRMLYAMAKKKKKEREEELREAAKSQGDETSIFSEEESEEDENEDASDDNDE